MLIDQMELRAHLVLALIQFGPFQWIRIRNDFRWLFIEVDLWLRLSQSSAYFYEGSYGLTAHYLYACDIDVSVFKEKCVRHKAQEENNERSQWQHNHKISI